MNGDEYFIYETKGFWDLWSKGRHYRVVKERAYSRSSSHGVHAHGVKSPMPGKIVKLFVKNGDVVEKGDLLLVMEAMKMEYRILAPEKGVIASLPFSQGDQVEMGVELVVFKD